MAFFLKILLQNVRFDQQSGISLWYNFIKNSLKRFSFTGEPMGFVVNSDVNLNGLKVQFV